MKIAFISFEYPPKTAVGGIGTYVYQAAHILQERGNYVEVFATTENSESISDIEDNLLVHRVKTLSKETFREEVYKKFKERHSLIEFDIIEAPEYRADTLQIQRKITDVPVHIKLHTPDFLVAELNRNAVSWQTKLRFSIGAYIRFKKPKPYWLYTPNEDPEYLVTKSADYISSPSLDLARIVSERWSIERKRIGLLPYPFSPSEELLNITPGVPTSSRPTITFVGKLEKRKGVLNFIEIVPEVVKQHPEVIFRFLGRPIQSPNKNLNMQEYISLHLSKYKNNLQFVGEIEYKDLPTYLSDSTICLFPSLWENFPNVCLEAMSAARCVIGSKEGGMAEMLDKGSGILISPQKPKEISEAILQVLAEPELVKEYGTRARSKVLNTYNRDVIGKLYEETFLDIISKKRNA